MSPAKEDPNAAPQANSPSICTVLTFSVNNTKGTAANTTMRLTFLRMDLVPISRSFSLDVDARGMAPGVIHDMC
jgi:hypothetical protein